MRPVMSYEYFDIPKHWPLQSHERVGRVALMSCDSEKGPLYTAEMYKGNITLRDHGGAYWADKRVGWSDYWRLTA